MIEYSIIRFSTTFIQRTFFCPVERERLKSMAQLPDDELLKINKRPKDDVSDDDEDELKGTYSIWSLTVSLFYDGIAYILAHWLL